MDGSQHMSLAKRLAHPSDKDIRDAAFATVSAWLEGGCQLSEPRNPPGGPVPPAV